jgi:predicted DNA binding CopG/RHH family protein
MKKEYNFSGMKGHKNPYEKKLRRQVTLRLGTDVIEYFKQMAAETGIPYQNLINLYLRQCAQTRKKLSLRWAS